MQEQGERESLRGGNVRSNQAGVQGSKDIPGGRKSEQEHRGRLLGTGWAVLWSSGQCDRPSERRGPGGRPARRGGPRGPGDRGGTLG